MVLRPASIRTQSLALTSAKAIANKSLRILAPGLWRIKERPWLLILAYHRVLPTGHPDRTTEQPGMYVSPDTLALHLKVLRRYFTITPLSQWIAGVVRGEVPDRACAITFDDGWRDNFDHAFPVLRSEGVPATIFLVSDYVGSSYQFWPTRLARLLLDQDGSDRHRRLRASLGALGDGVSGFEGEGSAFSQREVDEVIGRCKSQYTDQEIMAFLDAAERKPAESARLAERDILTWDEIRVMSDSGLIEFGSHTRRHIRLESRTTTEVMREEIVGSKRVLEERLGRPVHMFCYPNGDYCPAAVELVRNAYSAAVTMNRGTNPRSCNPYLLRRVGVHDAASNTRNSFLAWLARASVL